MANELRLGQISQYVPVIWESSLWYLQENFIMPRLIKTFSDQSNWAPRQVTQYSEPSVSENLGELEDLSPNLLERALRAQLRPAEHGTQYLITDRRLEGDTDDIIMKASQSIGQALGKHLEENLLGNFTSFEGGTVGATNASLTLSNIYQARARLAAANIPGPYRVVLHEYQWLTIALTLNLASTSNFSPLTVRNDIQNRYYMASLGPDIDIFVSNLLPITGSGASAYTYGGLFAQDAMAWDLRRGLRIETDRDPSLRSGELNATWVYAHGVWLPEYGIQLPGLAAAPGSDVTVNSELTIVGAASDSAPSATDTVHYTFVIVNTGSVVARDITMTIADDADFTFVDDSSEVSQGIFTEASLSWAAGDLAPGDSATLQFDEVVGGTGASTVVATINATTGVEPDLAGNATCTVSVTVS